MDATIPLPSAAPVANPLRGVNARAVVARLALWMLAGVLLTAGITAGLIAVGHRPDWWGAWLAALVVGLAAAVTSLAPVAPGILAGPQWAAYGYLAGSIVRVLAALFGCLAAVWVVRTPPVATLMLVLPLYFVQVTIEVIVLARAFWPRG